MVTVGSMTPEDLSNLSQFADRMNEICDDMGVTRERGRQIALARQFGVTNKSARKWLLGLNYPELPLAIRIADWAKVNVTWLLQGTGPKRGTRVDAKALVLDEAVRSLPPDLGADLIDNIRAKLVRIGKIEAHEPSPSRYTTMLDAYNHEIARKH